MNLNLTKPIVFFDLETTGVNIATDRVVEIAILKVFPNGNKESKTWLVNPEVEIPAAATAVDTAQPLASAPGSCRGLRRIETPASRPARPEPRQYRLTRPVSYHPHRPDQRFR